MNITRGNRLTSWMGLRMDEGKEFAYPRKAENNYGFVEIPVRELVGKSEKAEPGKALRNQHIQVVAACVLNVRGHCRVQVVPNPALNEYGIVQGMYYIESGDGEVSPSFYISLRKDLDIADINYAVRLYLWDS